MPARSEKVHIHHLNVDTLLTFLDDNVTITDAIAATVGQTAKTNYGLDIVTFDETVNCAGNLALYQTLTNQVPANSIILNIQANILATLTGGSTTVKVGIGAHASSPSLYGKTADLVKNTRLTPVLPTMVMTTAATPIDVCAVATAGAAGDTPLTVGKVRVVCTYLVLPAIADA